MMYKHNLTGELCNVIKLNISDHGSWYSCYSFGFISERNLQFLFTKIKLTSRLRKA